MPLYIYDSTQREDLLAELKIVRNKCQDVVPFGVAPNTMRAALRALSHHHVLVVPTQMEHLTPNVERLKQVGHLIGLQVMPLASYLAGNRRITSNNPTLTPVAAAAVPPTQQRAAAGERIHR